MSTISPCELTLLFGAVHVRGGNLNDLLSLVCGPYVAVATGRLIMTSWLFLYVDQVFKHKCICTASLLDGIIVIMLLSVPLSRLVSRWDQNRPCNGAQGSATVVNFLPDSVDAPGLMG